jgi:hypothetical protein
MIDPATPDDRNERLTMHLRRESVLYVWDRIIDRDDAYEEHADLLDEIYRVLGIDDAAVVEDGDA